MTHENALNDLDYLRSVAQSGENTPLLGGPIGLMWGILLTAVFTYQWAVLAQLFPADPTTLLFAWFGFAVVGGLGTLVLGRKISQKAGSSSTANKVESYVWTMYSAMMSSLFVGIILKMLLSGGTYALYDFMVVAGFAGQAMCYAIVAKVTGRTWLKWTAITGFIASAVAFVALGEPHLYLVAAIATTFTVIIPSLYSMSEVRRHAG
ncbi:hypothetical protein [Robiginitomaculum antarcticum]|uniref:hypothetical protein n=1 Tax=Robiginitomaculum antarcticum TaxID=437507 RepID=UPI00035C5895|nr:hypothetical protein [Robiginitomaculum antarcticum]